MLRKMIWQVVGVMMLAMFSAPAFGSDMSSIKNYSADMETTSKQGTFNSKMFYKDTKMRMETSEKGHNSIVIMRPDKQVMWMLMPSEKSYMEMPLDMTRQDIQSKLRDPNIKVDKKFISNEVVDKHPTKKYHITVITGTKKEESGHVWEAVDLSNFPIKHESEDKSVTTVWKNFKSGGVTDSVFEVPAGFTRMDMPAMPQGMGGGMPRKQKKPTTGD